jgi:hypothetical protein
MLTALTDLEQPSIDRSDAMNTIELIIPRK